MLERTLEIALSRYPELLAPGWSLVGQQLGTGVGILDLLFKDSEGRLQLVEVKKGPATIAAVTQVLRYAGRYLEEGHEAVAWVVAHSIPAAAERYASNAGVRTKAISASALDELLAARGTTVEALATLRRRDPEALSGGAGDLWSNVPSETAYAEMSNDVSTLLRDLTTAPHTVLKSGAMQTTIWYRGVKLGGFNRRHRGGVGYVTSGVVSTALRKQLEKLGFSWMEKGGKAHVHTWMEISGARVPNFKRGLDLLRSAIDSSMTND